MVQVSYPGVYVQERSSGVKTITGVATSITAFFGRALKGPLNKPVRCLSYADFVRNFGGSPVGSELAISVKAFYDNGGSDCYVVRLARNARRAAVELQNYANTAVLEAVAKVEGLWGNGLRLEVDYNTTGPGDTFNLRVVQEDAGKVVASESFLNLSMDFASPRFAPTLVSQSSALIDLRLAAGLGVPSSNASVYQTSTAALNGFSEARRPFVPNPDADAAAAAFGALLATTFAFEISVNGSAYVPVNLQGLPALTAANLAAQVQGRVNAALATLTPAPTVTVSFAAAAAGHFLRITSDSGDHSAVRVRRAAANDLAGALLLGVEQGGVELTRFHSLRPAATGSLLRVGTSAMGLENLNTLANTVQNAVTTVTVGSDAAVPLNLVTVNNAAPWFQDGLPVSPSGHSDGVREKLNLIAAAISAAPGGHYRAERQGSALAIVPKAGTFNELPAAVTFAGALPAVDRNTRQYKFGFDGSSAFARGGSLNPNTGVFETADDGDDGLAPDFATYTGDQSRQTGFYALDPVDLVNLLVIPADDDVPEATRSALWGPASIYCRSRRAFLLIDPPVTNWTTNGLATVVQAAADRAGEIRAAVVKDHSAVFYPRIRINDAGTVRTVGATGAIAGLMARTDATRGVWKAPAGVEADLRGLAGLEVKLTDLENGVLNQQGINCLRQFPAGFVSWGARTVDGADDLGSEWKYIPIRRLALFLEESLYRGTQWAVFEPNDEPLWAKLRLNVGVFMNGLFRQGAFQGSTPDKAFYVKCDAETTTQADRNLGIVNIEVGFAPLKPAEFVVITIQQIAGDLK